MRSMREASMASISEIDGSDEPWIRVEAEMPSSSTIGKITSTLLGARPRHLEASIARIASAPPSLRAASGSFLDEYIWLLRGYAKDAAQKGESLDQLLIPMIQQSLNLKGSNNWKQALVLLSWLLEDEFLLHALSSELVQIIVSKEDHYIALGWLILVGRLVELIINRFPDKGQLEKSITLLKILFQPFSHLLTILCKGSTLQGEYESPTRLSVAAADCMLLLIEALAKAAYSSKELSNSKAENQLSDFPSSSYSTATFPQGLEEVGIEMLLWDHLDELIVLVQKLRSWSRKSQNLRARALGRVLEWLETMKCHYKNEAALTGQILLNGVTSLFCTCWKHYATLMRINDHRFSHHHQEMLEQYISAIQYYTSNEQDARNQKTSNSTETRRFVLNCLSLLWGWLDERQLEKMKSVHGLELLNLLFSQIKYGHGYLADEAVEILAAILFKMNLSTYSSSPDTNWTEEVVPLFLSLLDDGNTIPRAVLSLFAEYCSKYLEAEGLQEIFKRLKAENFSQKRNAVDVLAVLIDMPSDSKSTLSSAQRQDIARNLLDCVADGELMSYASSCNLISKLDPHYVLPTLVRLVFSENKSVVISAGDAIASVLRFHGQNLNVVHILLDCISDLGAYPEVANNSAKSVGRIGQKLDVDLVLRLIPKWSENVSSWNLLIEEMISKMFLDPSNSVIVRFMSYISKHLAEAKDVVFRRVLSHMQEHGWFTDSDEASSKSDLTKIESSLFDHLCPLLLLRLLPLQAFDDLSCLTLYGNLYEQVNVEGKGDVSLDSHDSIAVCLLKRALGMVEFEEVQKLAAELCGRLHPQIQDISGTSDCVVFQFINLLASGNHVDAVVDMIFWQKSITVVGYHCHLRSMRRAELLPMSLPIILIMLFVGMGILTLLLEPYEQPIKTAAAYVRHIVYHYMVHAIVFQVLLPIIDSQLVHATQCRDIQKLKACLFAVCTSLVARDTVTALHPTMSRIRKIVVMILCWPSFHADEVSKAQHGCIDCLALMICAEVKYTDSMNDLAMKNITFRGEAKAPGDCALISCALDFVIQNLICDVRSTSSSIVGTALHEESSSDNRSRDVSASTSEAIVKASKSVPFRLCMANVLISACQKVSSSGKQPFASKMVPALIHSIETLPCSDTRAPCIQVLFSAVYHLKSCVLPFSSNLLKISIKALRKGSAKEKLAAAKLLTSLMASDDVIIESMSGGILEAKSVLEEVVTKDSCSEELRQLCSKLLLCISSPLDPLSVSSFGP